jgi:uncharacterized membrane protein YeiB
MFGIMLVNFPTMNTRAGEETTQYGGVHGALDRAAGVANMALCNGKFYPIFALIFGWGLAVLWRSQERRGHLHVGATSRVSIIYIIRPWDVAPM